MNCNDIASGIIASNSVGNTFECNPVYNSDYGLAILYNAAGQTIKTNYFDDCRIDLGIHSEIGWQIHKGNDFVRGSTRAEGLSINELNNSLFFVDSSYMYHMPVDPKPPTGWFFHEDSVDLDCFIPVGPSFPEFYNDTIRLCDYYNRLKGLKDSLPNVFFVNLFHLLKYEQAREEFTLPDCIKTDSLLTRLCGLGELVDVDSELRNINEPLDERDPLDASIQKIDELQQEYIETTDSLEKQLILTELKDSIMVIHPALNQIKLSDSLKLDEIRLELDSIDCSEYIVQLWVDILGIYIDFLQAGEIAETNRIALLFYSRLCSDEYGDYIHLARSMAMLFDSTYFDVYDDCREGIQPRSINKKQKELALSVIPNPNNGQFTVYLDSILSGIFVITNVNGQEVMRQNFEQVDKININNLIQKGIFFITVSTTEGQYGIKKFVITD